MSPRAARRLAYALAAIALLLLLAGVSVFVAIGDLGSTDVFTFAFVIAFSAVGVVIASRHPGNAIGWILLGVAVATGLGSAAHGYAEYWLAGKGGSEALGRAAALYGELSWMPFVLVPATFLLLVFPDGRLLSPRWRPVAWCAAVGIAGSFVTEGLAPGRIADYPQVTNPYGVDSPLRVALEGIAILALFVGIAGSCLSLILRFRRAGRRQRQQIKWLAYAGAVAGVTIPIAGFALHEFLGETLANGAIMASVLGLPIAAGIAILRHGLYDIDVVINRTLVYGALTATLAAAYLGSVLLLQLVLRPLTEESNLAIAGSTLAVAALFRPARARIQAGVDRRFYRRRYDAARTLERFGAHLRDEVDLGALSAELRTVVADAMQPAHVSLWIRGPR